MIASAPATSDAGPSPAATTVPAPPRRPLYFGRSGAQSFGFWHEPARPTRGLSVVLVNPFGYEWICAHRGLRHLAESLAAAGYGVLRFDYPGTGDSAGSDEQGDRIAAWQVGIGEAVDEALAIGGMPVAVVGFRLGATLAALALSDRPDVAAMVLVAPVASGKAYARELRALQLAMDLPAAPAGEDSLPEQEAVGFLVNPATRAALDALALERAVHPPHRRVLLVERADMPSDARVTKALGGLGSGLETVRATGYDGLVLDPHKTVVPVELWRTIERWLDGAAAVSPPPGAQLPGRSSSRAAARVLELDVERLPPLPGGAAPVATRVRETPLAFGPNDRLFGILSEPVDAVERRRTAVVLLNPGAVHRVGCNRMWVTWARAWAALGFSVLRLDVGGLGDSAPAPGVAENQTYAPDALSDVRAAVLSLGTATGISRVVVGGLCSGAYLGFHAALSDSVPGVVGALLVNPVTFYWKPGMSLDVSPVKAYKQTSHYKRAIWQGETWRKALRGQIDWSLFAQSVARRSREVTRAKLAPVLRRLGVGGEGDDLDGNLRKIAARGVRTLFVFSEREPGLDALALHASAAMRTLQDSGAVRLVTVPATDHTFTPLWSQRRLAAELTGQLLARFADT